MLDVSREELITIFLEKRRRTSSKKRSAVKSGPVALPRDRAFPLSYVQERLWILQHRNKDNAYNMSGGVMLEGALSVKALEEALYALVERHEPLRTRFVVAPGESEPHVEIEPARNFELAVRDADEEQAAGLISEQAGQVFDLEKAPFSVQLLRMGPNRHILSLALVTNKS